MGDVRELVTGPIIEPVSPTEAKAQCRIEVDDESALITALITAAREAVEHFTRRQLLTATWRLKLDSWSSGCESDLILLPYPPLQSVASVQYVDGTGATQSLVAGTDYVVDTADEPGRVVLQYGKTWPTLRGDRNAVTITYVAGWTGASLVPGMLRHAIKLLIAHWYESREPVVTGTIVTEVPKTVEYLLRPWQVPDFV